MSSSPTLTCFCLFCYKSIKNSGETPQNAEQFIKIVNNFYRRKDVDQKLTNRLVELKLLECCYKCTEIIEGFSKNYINLKVLELKLDYLLDNLVEKINYANKVPVRWMNVNSVLDERLSNGLDNKAEFQNKIRALRQNVIEAGHHRKLRSEPHVLLNRHMNDIQLTKPSGSRTTTNLTNYPNKEITFRRKSCKIKECQLCKKSFKTFKGLEDHLETHKPPSERKWQCSVCKKGFSSQINLKVHFRSHTGERPFKCGYCGIKLRYRSNYTNHLKTQHGNEKGLEMELKRNWFKKKSSEDKRGIKKDGVLPKTKRQSCTLQQTQYSLRDNRPTTYAYLEDIEIDDDQDDFIDDMSANLASDDVMIESTTFPDDDHEERTEYDDMPELEDYSGEINGELENESVDVNNMETMENVPIFTDPLIQVKVEHRPVAENRDLAAEDVLTPDIPILTNVSKEDTQSTEKSSKVLNKIQTRGKHQCPKCGKAFKNGYVLQVHMEYHKDPKDWKWTCNKCEKKFATRLNLQAHMKAHTKQMVTNGNKMSNREMGDPALNKAEMEIKPETQSSRYGLREHRVTRYSTVDVDEINSDEDDDNSKDNAYQPDIPTSTYLKVEPKRTGYPKRRKLKLGMTRRHKSSAAGPRSKKSTSDPKPFVLECEICTRKFTSILNKEYHFKKCHALNRKSDKQTTYKCDRNGCSAYFLTKPQLLKHFHIEHHEKGMMQRSEGMEKRFGCTKCDKRFAHRSTLDVHMEYHKEPSEWKWECEICGKKSATKFKLAEHKRVHTKEKPFKCRFCKERFTYTPTLNEHLKEEHGDEEEVKAEISGMNIDVITENAQGMESGERKERIAESVKCNLENDNNDRDESEGIDMNTSDLGDSDPNNLLKWKGECFGDGTLVEFEDLD